MKSKNGFARIINATGYTWRGLRAAYQNEAAFRQECWLILLLIPAAFYVPSSLSDTAILIASLLFILLVELVNSAIEAVVDRISDEHHVLSGRAKDMGSAAVFVAFVIAGLIWYAVLF
jgi:diacylglycerol kinase (ATP)